MLDHTTKGLVCASLVISWTVLGVGQTPVRQRTEPAERTLESPSLLISLFPRSGKPTEQDRSRRASLELRLKESVAPLLEETPYGSVSVEVPVSWEQVATRLRRGSSTVVECDPVLYFSALSSRENSAARYQVILQQISPDLPRGQVLALEEDGIRHPEELRGRRVGFVHRVAGGGAQVQRALMDLGLSANRDYQIWNARYVENAFLCLKANQVDAIVVPSDAAEMYLRNRPFPPVRVLLSAEECLPPLFAMRGRDLESSPALAKRLVEELRTFFGPQNLVESSDDLYDTVRRESLPWEGYGMSW